MPAYYVNSSSIFAVANAYLSLPSNDFTGFCSDSQFAEFEVPSSDQTCTRKWDIDAPTFQSMCSVGPAAVGSYAGSVYVLKTP